MLITPVYEKETNLSLKTIGVGVSLRKSTEQDLVEQNT